MRAALSAIFLSATVLVCSACLHGNDVVLTEVHVYTLYFEPPTLTTREKEAVLCYCKKMRWQPFHLDPPGTTNCGILPEQPPIDVECIRWFRDGTHWATSFRVDEDFEPERTLLGQETPEYHAMADALKSFRRRTSLRPSARFKEWQEMLELQKRSR